MAKIRIKVKDGGVYDFDASEVEVYSVSESGNEINISAPPPDFSDIGKRRKAARQRAAWRDRNTF